VPDTGDCGRHSSWLDCSAASVWRCSFCSDASTGSRRRLTQPKPEASKEKRLIELRPDVTA
jgi:hypothetical protein